MDNKEMYKINILKAATEIIQKQGVKSLTISNIVEKCNISRRSFYDVFPTKQDLEAALNEILSEEYKIKSKKDEIIAQAQIAFAKYGYNNVDIDTIAKASGTNRAIVYKYFSTKDELFAYCFQLELEMIKQNLLEKLLNPTDALAAFNDYYETFFIYLENYYQHTLLKEVNEQLIRNQKINQNMQEYAKFLIGLYENFLKLGIKQGVFKEDLDVASTAVLMHTMTIGMTVYREVDQSIDLNGKIKNCYIYILISAICK